MEGDKSLLVASELKAFAQYTEVPRYLKPGYSFTHDGKNSMLTQFFEVEKFPETIKSPEFSIESIKSKLFSYLNHAVKKMIDANGNLGALLSGGIDSSIICGLTLQHVSELDVYTVAVEGSQDLEYAREFAKKYKENLNHHYFMLDIDEMLKIVPGVIYSLETFDAALIRSAIPMYYLSSKLEGAIDLLLTGEGGDELFGGYSYLQEMNDEQIREEMIELLRLEHALGLQRVDRIPYSFGIEARAPFFDIKMVKLAFQIPLEMKLKKVEGKLMEKWILRETFQSLLPKTITWRRKAKFSKGVGSQFMMRNHINELISDEEFKEQREIFPEIFVKSKEELYYWHIFEDHFNPHQDFVEALPRTSTFIK